MDEYDILHMIIKDEIGNTILIQLYGEESATIPEDGGGVGFEDYDGNNYTEVTIGTQKWIVENLRTTHYGDGTLIPRLTVNADWEAEDGTVGHDGAYCEYNNDILNIPDHGLIYNSYAVINSKNIAYLTRNGIEETGWRVPTKNDWDILVNFLGGTDVAGGKMKEIGTDHWLTPNTDATNSSGLTVRGSGLRDWDGAFSLINEFALLASQTLFGAAYRQPGLEYLLGSCYTDGLNAPRIGASIRLVKQLDEGIIYDYDGNEYTYVTIGSQQWMVENLRVTRFTDGVSISNLTAAGDWAADINGAYCWYNNDISYKNVYGALYNWHAVNNAHGLAPTGWRVPTLADYNTLIATVGAFSGLHLRETGYGNWTLASPAQTALDTYGFKAVPTQFRNFDGTWSVLPAGETAIWYLNELVDPTTVKDWYISYNSANAGTSDSPLETGVSIRCMRDI